MTTHMPPGALSGRGRQMLSKVPEVTVYFWVIKIMATTVGRPRPTCSTRTSASA